MATFHEVMLRLAVAALLGAVIGIERDWHRRPAGVRTSAFVCLGSALFTIMSFELAHRYGDSSSTRIASNIVQGIGFLGAGAILRESGGIVGLTTAATIFAEAAIGMAAGGGMYAVAGYSTGLVLFGLVVVGLMTRRSGLRPRLIAFRVTASHVDNVASEVQQLLHRLKVEVQHFRVTMSGTNSVVEFQGDVSHETEQEMLKALTRPEYAVEVTPLREGHE